MRLEPLSQFVLSRGLEDHTDSTTYYVQAVIRDAKTDQLIDTVNLEDKGNRRFSKAWRVPQDPTGEGRDILITYTVYTDSGYTTKAENYGEKFIDYRIEHIPRHQGSGGADIDYKKIQKLIDSGIEKIKFPDPPTIPEMPNIPFYLQPVLNAITRLRNDFKTFTIPEADFSGVEFRLNLLEKDIKAIEIPETDLNPVIEAILALKEAIKPMSDSVEGNSTQVRLKMDVLYKNLSDLVSKLKDEFSKIPFVAISPQKREQVEKIDYDELLK